MPRQAQRNLFKITLTCLMVLSSVLGLGNLSTVQAQPNGQAKPASVNGLVINEVFDSQSTASEYFELFNTSSVSINLSTYVVCNKDDCDNLSVLANPNIGAGEYRAIGQAQLGSPIGGATGLASTDFVGLRNTSPTDQVIDVVNFGNPPDLGWHNYDLFSCCYFGAGQQPSMPADGPKSIQRWPDGQDADRGSDWQLISRSAGTASCGDPYEADDTLGTAAPQNPNTTNLHRLCPSSDNDYVSFSASPSFTYTLQATATGSRVDTFLRLYDTSGNVVAEDNPTPGRNSQINFRPSTAGTYRAQIFDANNQGDNGPDFLYNFTITQLNAATPTPALSPTPTSIACEDQYEPDNVFPQEARTLELNSEQVHTFCRGGTTQPDTDWLTFTATPGKIYTFYTKDLSGPTDTLLSLYESDGTKLYQNDDYQPGQGLASRIDWSFTTAGRYYLAARESRGGSGPNYRYTVGMSTTGQLPPSSTPTATNTSSPFSPTPTSGPCYDAFEPDGVPETARIIYIGQTQAHNICPVTDADWVKFYGRAGKAYTIATNNLGIGLDTYMWIFASDTTTILAYNDDGGNGVASRIDFVPLKDDFYYVQIKNAGDLGLPEMTYDLSLAVTPALPQPPSTATGIIAPPVTVTAGEELPSPTTIVLPTKPPLPSPTQAAPEPTQAVPSPVATTGSQVQGEEGGAPAEPTAEPTKVPATKPPTVAPTEVPPAVVEPTQVPPEEEAGAASIPGVPNTGGLENVPVVDSVSAPPAAVRMAPILFRVFYDRDHNDSYSASEGIKGVSVFFLDVSANFAPTASLLTPAGGESKLQVPVTPQKVYIPYFNLFMPLTRFPERELHSIWLPAVKLPVRVP